MTENARPHCQLQKLKTIDLDEVKKYLSKRQLDELEERISNVIGWGK